MSRALDDLSPRFRPQAVEFLARCAEAGLAILIVETLRTPAEHAANLAAGRSWITHSKHLDGLAMDVCLFAAYELHGPDKLCWNAADPGWAQLATIAERVGLRSGYRWQQKDCGHVELPG